MRSILITAGAAVACLASPAAAQYYAGPQQAYTAPSAYQTYQTYNAPPAYHHQQAYAQALPPLPPAYDRNSWMRDCRVYLRERRRRGEAGGVIGGVIGAAGGAYAGNRIAEDGSRLAGSLIGGGIGGLAGLAIGTLIGLAGRDDTKRDCKDWLNQYERAYANQVAYGGGYGHNYGGSGYGYTPGYGGGYTTSHAGGVVVTIEHHSGGQRYVPVIREEVTEEYYEVEDTAVVRERAIERTPVVPRAQPTKRIKYIKGR